MESLHISSLKNPRVQAARLLREGKARRRQKLFLVDGAREIGRALTAGIECLEIFCLQGKSPEDRWAKELTAQGTSVYHTTPTVQAKIAFGDRNDEPVAVCRWPDRSLEQLKLTTCPLLLVLAGVEKPGNVGAVLRSADAAGVTGVILADKDADPWNANCIRASTGAVFSMNLAACEEKQAFDWLRQKGLKTWVARVDAGDDLFQVDFTAPVAIVLGSEAWGLGPLWDAPSLHGVRIPMLGQADSLNVSISAALLAYEALRQRRSISP